jgi:phosphohistidine swiveling domain-containing protein
MGKEVVNQYQPSISEWFALISETKEAEAFRLEDNHKVDRLDYLHQKIGLPYERPEKLPAIELSEPSKRFLEILKKRGNELCAIRLVPNEEGLPKIRNRGLSIRRCYEDWYLKQKIDPTKYDAYICPHCEYTPWSMIFIVKPDLIFGEIIPGLHCQLTQGTTVNEPIDFQYDFSSWVLSKEDQEALSILKRAVKIISVKPSKLQGEMAKDLEIEFTHNILCGYFEAVVWPDNKIYFIDYNRVIPKFVPSPPNISLEKSFLQGKIAYQGRVEGRVKIVNEGNLSSVKFSPGMILVCENTDVRYLPFIKQAGAIVTDRGGLLSHASIIARELKVPCLLDTKNATKLLKDDQKIIVDADKGIIILK